MAAEGWGFARQIVQPVPSINEQITLRSQLRIAAKAFVEQRSEANFFALQEAVKALEEA